MPARLERRQDLPLREDGDERNEQLTEHYAGRYELSSFACEL